MPQSVSARILHASEAFCSSFSMPLLHSLYPRPSIHNTHISCLHISIAIKKMLVWWFAEEPVQRLPACLPAETTCIPFAWNICLFLFCLHINLVYHIGTILENVWRFAEELVYCICVEYLHVFAFQACAGISMEGIWNAGAYWCSVNNVAILFLNSIELHKHFSVSSIKRCLFGCHSQSGFKWKHWRF